MAAPLGASVLSGTRRGQVVSFLTRCLGAQTQQRYLGALDAFSNELLTRGLRLGELDGEAVDWLLADKVLDI